MPPRHDRRDLDGLKHPVVIVGLDRAQGTHHLGIAGAESDAPARHVVAFAHRREFDADVLGPRRRQKTRRQVTVKRDVGIGKVANHHETVTPSQFDDVDKKLRLDRDR